MLAYDVATHLAREIGARPAGSAAERRALSYVEERFRAAGLRVGRERFRVPGRGMSSDVIGIWDTPARCLVIVMAHADSVARARGGDDNASGAGVVAALAPRLRVLRPRCDVWLVATGAEEREWTGSPDHLGSVALVQRVRRLGRGGDLRLALSVDMLGADDRFWLRSPRAAPGRAERSVLTAAAGERVTVSWVRDSGTGNSDHREFALAGFPAANLEAWRGSDPCHHKPCDTWRRIDTSTLSRAEAVVARVLRDAS
ncbi:MAG TPA: M28 family peptidase [Solirubrobacteraceae bacterium]|nr:M28 family peptidase [Solirubrobacteraceae bacterium]